MMTVEGVASTIIDLIRAQINELTTREKPTLREKIKLNVLIPKTRLRELSGRRHIRHAFTLELIQCINIYARDMESSIEDRGVIRIVDKPSPNVIRITNLSSSVSSKHP